MLWLAIAMMAVLAMWALLAGAFIGIGLLWRSIFNPDSRRLPLRGDDLFLAFWSGFALVLMFLQFWHLARPIDGVALTIVLAVGLLALAPNVSRFNLTRPSGMLLALAIVALWIANRAIGPGNAEDSGLYHYRAIRWATSYAIVPGMGNLSAALALNNVSFLYTAMLEAGSWHGRSNHLANGLLLLILFIGIIVSATRIWRVTWKNLAADAYLLTLLPIALYLALGKDVSSPKTDLPVGVMTFVIGHLALRLLTENADRRFRLLTLALLCAAAICLKFSGVVVVTLIGLVALVAWLKRDRPARREVLATVAGVLVVTGLLIGPWVARNRIMSGYPLYPSKVAAAVIGDVEWKVPEPAVDYLVGSIRNQAKAGLIIWAHDNLVKTNKKPLVAYARLMKPPFTSRDKVKGLEWVRPWFFSLPVTSPIEVVLPMCITLAAWLALWRRGIPHARDALPLLLPMLAGVAFWLWAGPEPRYGWQTMWALAAAAVALAAMSIEEIASPRILRLCVWIALLLCTPAIAYRAGISAIVRQRNPLTEIPFQPPGSDHGFHPKPTQTWTIARTRWATEIYVPAGVDQPLSWDGPLPATSWPPLDMDVRLRKPGDLSAGFVTDRGGS
ncbi:MAG: hypothetical protein ABIP55_10330 [Tepidisphaeraceae bacterium]